MEINRLKEMLIRHEGNRLKPYRCTAGKLTLGVGRNIQERGITMEESMHLLDNDIAVAARELRQSFPWFTELDPVRQDVLVDMHFMGLPKLLEFKKFLAAMAKKDYLVASVEMLDSEWAKQVGYRARELSIMMLKGEYVSDR